jgi:hypothetical protein
MVNLLGERGKETKEFSIGAATTLTMHQPRRLQALRDCDSQQAAASASFNNQNL